jgi:hypothetical protein
MRALAWIAMLMGGGCGFSYGTKVSPAAAPFSYNAWGADSGVAYGNAMEKAQSHRHAFQEPERVKINCPFYWIKPLVAAPIVGGFAVTAVQDNALLSAGLATSLALLLFVPNCRATIGYEREFPTSLVAPPAPESSIRDGGTPGAVVRLPRLAITAPR